MNLKQMEYFITIVNEGSISAAAKSLHISQPPLSTQMKLLEEELGVTLFPVPLSSPRRENFSMTGPRAYWT